MPQPFTPAELAKLVEMHVEANESEDFHEINRALLEALPEIQEELHKSWKRIDYLERRVEELEWNHKEDEP